MRHLVHPQPSFPHAPGVYTWRVGEQAIYIGKAKNLAKRLKSYYRSAEKLDPKTRVMVALAETIEWIELESEEQALLLEAQLIKRHRPQFNIRLKDDRAHPYIAITDHRYPRVVRAHRTGQPGWTYYGPYANGKLINEAVDALNALYLAPLWKGQLHRKRHHPPVEHAVWMRAIDQITSILEGDETWVSHAHDRMKEHAQSRNFEYAAKLRDWIQAVKHLAPRSPLDERDSFDVIGWDQDGDLISIQIMQLRRGELAGQRSYTSDTGSVEATILEAYRIEPAPARVYVRPMVPRPKLIEQGLARQVLLARGGKIGYAQTAQRNASNTLRYTAEYERTHSPKAAVKALEKVLALKSLSRIECYDISNLGSRHPVGAMSVMIDGVSVRRHYRRWQMEASGQDDFLMIEQLIEQRLAQLDGKDTSLQPTPDLIVIDGGPQQLAGAVRAMQRSNQRIPIISLAKRYEQVHVPGQAQPLDLPRDHIASRLLQRARNEVHATAVARHRELRDEAMISGDLLSDVKGLGPKRRERLMQHFGSLDNILQASQDELETVLGPLVAEQVYRQLQR